MPEEVAEKLKTERWAIAVNDWPSFSVVRARLDAGTYSDELLNGTYPSRLAAIEQVIDDLERSRRELAEQIARAKRMRNRAAQGMPREATRRECGSGALAPASPVRAANAPKGAGNVR